MITCRKKVFEYQVHIITSMFVLLHDIVVA